MDIQAAATSIFICLFLGVASVVLIVYAVKFSRAKPLAPQKDPQLLAYLASRGYANPPSGDPTPSSMRGLYSGPVFGTCNEIAFAYVVSTYRTTTTTMIFAAKGGMSIGAWYSVPRAHPDWSAHPITFLGFGKPATLNTRDANYDALVETFGEGAGPSPEVRARVLAFPGGVRSAGWYEGRVMVSLTTQKELDPVRLDAAFDLVRALLS